MKVCNKCGQEKSLEDFYNHVDNRSGRLKFHGSCKDCFKARMKALKGSYVPLHYRNLDSRFKNLLTKARTRKTKKVSSTLTPEYLRGLWETQQGLCAYSRVPLQLEANHPHAISLDRVDSNKGYQEGNLQLVSASVNRMKQEFGEAFFIDLCYQIANNLSKTTQETGPCVTDPRATPHVRLAS